MRMAVFLAALFFAAACTAGCGSTTETRGVTVAQIRALESFDSLLPVGADSVVRLYTHYDEDQFHKTHQRLIAEASAFIDSLNRILPLTSTIDTLAIDHSFDNFAMAACTGRTICISSSYFLLYNDSPVIRSVILHEFGHLVYNQLSSDRRRDIDTLWTRLGNAALLYLYRDGEYSGNARFGGHPYDSPTEFFASAFNLLQSRDRELANRLQYVDPKHLPLIERVRRTVLEYSRKK
jgi:hypothetical protein